jgi:hypothetical protein
MIAEASSIVLPIVGSADDLHPNAGWRPCGSGAATCSASSQAEPPEGRLGPTERNTMSKLLRAMAVVTVALVAMLTFAAGALADSPRFKSASASGPDAAGNLLVSFRETGLGNTPNPVNYTASADADALYACQNNGGNFPSDPKKQQTSARVEANVTLLSENGNVVGSATLSPPPSTLSCPGGQHAVLASITYTNVQICDTDHNVCRAIPGTFSRTFFNV